MKKTISIILAIVMIFATASVAVSADDRVYEKREVATIIYTFDNMTTLECVFASDLPEVVFMDPVDYLGIIFTNTFTEVKNDDGTYTVANVDYPEATMVIDADNDTVTFNNYDDFGGDINEEGSSIEVNFIDSLSGGYLIDPEPVTLYFGDYGIDIVEIDGKVYLPLVTLAAMCSLTYNNAFYYYDEDEGYVCFVHSMDPESYHYIIDMTPIYTSLTRTPEEAEFSYATLCFMIDYFYGKPSNTLLSGIIEYLGLDFTLEIIGEYTLLVKELLLSENMSEYLSGLVILGYFLFDGGHTMLSYPILGVDDVVTMSPLWSQWISDYREDTIVSDLCGIAIDDLFYTLDYTYGVDAVRSEEYEKYFEAGEVVKEWKVTETYYNDNDELVEDERVESYLIIHGDTAVYVFDAFELETPAEFKEALDIAEAAGVKNFILDDSCNGGGYVAAMEYIVTIITNADRRSSQFVSDRMNPLTGAIYEEVDILDLNLDGVFDDADNDVYYDFNFGILTSWGSFSCGNELPVNAAKLGVAILGETSGGGSCIVSERFLAEGFTVRISDINKSVVIGGNDVDLGAPVDYPLVGVNDEGDPDFAPMYDIEHLGELVNAFYNPEHGDANRDGSVNARDVKSIMRYAAGYVDPAFSFEMADYNGDGRVNNRDIILMMLDIVNGVI